MFKRSYSTYDNEYVVWTDSDVSYALQKRKDKGENIFIPSTGYYIGGGRYSRINPYTQAWNYDDFSLIFGVTKGTLYKFNSFLKKNLLKLTMICFTCIIP